MTSRNNVGTFGFLRTLEAIARNSGCTANGEKGDEPSGHLISSAKNEAGQEIGVVEPDELGIPTNRRVIGQGS
ncbi:MAG: hypothetical protein IPJ68_03070 [Candidatus Moraniibacteriota bacterium]|nr:MAG: hypothetical protein IPJ68_03070 [Candidatus Moranbacteria bacterium]